MLMLWAGSGRMGSKIFSRAVCAVIMAALASSLSSSRAYGDPVLLPDVSASVEAEASPQSNPASTSIIAPPATLPLALQVSNDGSPLNPGEAFASAMVSGGLDPTVSVSVSAQGETFTNPFAQGSFIAGASAILDYSFEIVGPTTAGTIPVLAQGDDSITQNIVGAFNSVQISTTLYVTNGAIALNETGGPFSTTINLRVGSVYDVHMEASAVVQVAPDEAIATAYVDPSFTIDPSFSDTYSIAYSPGVLDVPEPGNLSLISIALVGLLFSVPRAKHLR